MKQVMVLTVMVCVVLMPSLARAQETVVAVPAAADATHAADVMPPVVAEEVRGTPALPFDGSEVAQDQFLWTARPIVIFAETAADPAFQLQMELLRARPDPLAERDVVIVTDTDPAARSAIRLALRPRGFMLAIIGKDGQVEIRKPRPWDVREISRTIDKMPLRQQEIRDRGLQRQ